MSMVVPSRNRVAWYNGCFLDRSNFDYHVAQTRSNLLKQNADTAQGVAKVINLCEDRYHFLVAFTASILENMTTIMPANRSQGELNRITQKNENIRLINDPEIAKICQLDVVSPDDSIRWGVDLVPDSLVVAELYSSGSTGTPSVNVKKWGQLVIGAQLVYARFNLDKFPQPGIVATVPPQHMFGFEMSIVLPLVCGVTLHQSNPFYPLDIQRVLCDLPSSRILATTPMHLKACGTLDAEWPDIELVMSATAPLSLEVAHQREQAMNTEVKEVYGCSEAGAVATRRMTQSTNWELLADYTLSTNNGAARLHTPTKQEPTILPDKLEILSDRYFKLVARMTDMIKIGGKRASLIQIEADIKALPGVEDAVVFRTGHAKNQRERLTALVVAPGQASADLRKALLNNIDQVFLPRPLRIVPALPYNSTGKLPKANLLASLKSHTKQTNDVLTASFVIPSTHPSLAGHFPGNPVTPGVVTIDHVVRGLTRHLPGTSLHGLPRVKFLRPLLPDTEVKVTYQFKSENLYRFSGESSGMVILKGQIQLVTGTA